MIIMRIAGRLHGYHDDCWTIIITVIILVTLVTISFYTSKFYTTHFKCGVREHW